MAFSRMVHLLFKGESRQVFDFEKAMIGSLGCALAARMAKVTVCVEDTYSNHLWIFRYE
jgi:hypothetical protein